MSTELKLFIDGVEVKKGDELIRGSNVIIFDSLNPSGEIVDSEGKLLANHPDYYNRWTEENDEWKIRSLIPRKYAPAIFVFKDDKGNVVSAHLSGELYDSKPSSRAPTPSCVESVRGYWRTVYWPASDYLKDGHYVLHKEDGE